MPCFAVHDHAEPNAAVSSFPPPPRQGLAREERLHHLQKTLVLLEPHQDKNVHQDLIYYHRCRYTKNGTRRPIGCSKRTSQRRSSSCRRSSRLGVRTGLRHRARRRSCHQVQVGARRGRRDEHGDRGRGGWWAPGAGVASGGVSGRFGSVSV